MDIILSQSFCLFGLFLSMVAFTLLPMKIVRRTTSTTTAAASGNACSKENARLSDKYDTFVSLANCLSGGVFLSTFFVGLLPEVRQEMNAILREANVTLSLPPAELIVLLGFFLAMFVEQFAMSVKSKSSHQHRHHHHHHNHSHSSPETVCSTREQDTEEDDDGTGFFPAIMTTSDVAVNGDDHPTGASGQQAVPKVVCETSGHHHGHSHDVEALLDPASSGVRFGILILSLGVHSLFEGMALGLQDEVHTLLNLFVGVWIHECLIAFALGFSMLRVSLTTCRFVQIAVLFSSLIPTGQLIGIVIGSSQSWASRVLSTVLQAVAAGTFIQVTFLDIIPDGLGSPLRHDRHRMLKVFLIFLGFVCIAFVTIFVQVHAH